MSAFVTQSPIRLLVVDNDNPLLAALQEVLGRIPMRVFTATEGLDALDLASHERIDVVLLDIHLHDANGLNLLSKLKEKHPELEVIILATAESTDAAVQAMRSGAYDYMIKPIDLDELEIHIHKAYEKVCLSRRERQWVEHLAFESPRYKMVGASEAHQLVMQLIEKVAPTNTTVLIRGCSGTGKELVARALHHNSPRRTRPLVTVHCASLQKNLLECELFGHEKGAFTGAVQAKPGLIEVAEGGTLLIDEIAEMTPGVQAKLLRVLENGRFRRVGSMREAVADVRIIATTSKNLDEELKSDRFREDLFYRLNVVTIRLPALKDRREDIAVLAQHFVNLRKVGPGAFNVSAEAMLALAKYDWPGNVRELANVIERAQILAGDRPISLADLPDYVAAAHVTKSSADDRILLREVERHHVHTILQQSGGNKAHAAKSLGISRRALYRLIAKYHLAENRCGTTVRGI